jgi:hypothetical protein
VAEILEEFWLVEGQILRVETNCVVCAPGPWPCKFDDPWMRVVQPVGVCQTVLATLFGAWGLGETVCACMRVSCL